MIIALAIIAAIFGAILWCAPRVSAGVRSLKDADEKGVNE